MDAELVALASSGAGTLVTLMVTDSWDEVKAKVAALLGRHHADAEVVAGQLERARADVVAAHGRGDAVAAEDVAAQWRARLRQALTEDPEVAPLLAEVLRPYASAAGSGAASTSIHGNDLVSS